MRSTGRSGSVDPDKRGDARWALVFFLLTGLALGLIVLGALVRAHGAGLACPDWPRCFGRWLPEMNLLVAFEWGHRLVAGSLSLLFLGAGAATLAAPERRARCAKWLGAGFALLVVQVLLGALTVWLRLAPWTVVAHLVTANAFAVTLLLTGRRLRSPVADEGSARAAGASAPPPLLLVAAALLVLQVVLGGLVSSTHAGLACPEWPTCREGRFFPSWQGAMGLHLLHRTNAYLVLLGVLAAGWRHRHEPALALGLRLAALLVVLQVSAGVANVLLALPVEITALHSGLSAALVLTWAWVLDASVPSGGGRRTPRRARDAPLAASSGSDFPS